MNWEKITNGYGKFDIAMCVVIAFMVGFILAVKL